jgi:putative tricarboxylic transport membrane protein
MRRYLKNGDVLVSILITAIGLVFGVLASRFDIDIRPEYPGPKLFPYIACFGLVVCGLGMLSQAIGKVKAGEAKRYLSRESWTKAGVVLAMLIGYGVLLATLGFFIATPVATYAMVSYIAVGQRTKGLNRALFSVLFTAVLYLVYSVAFGMSLPEGSLL